MDIHVFIFNFKFLDDDGKDEDMDESQYEEKLFYLILRKICCWDKNKEKTKEQLDEDKKKSQKYIKNLYNYLSYKLNNDNNRKYFVNAYFILFLICFFFHKSQ